MPVVITLIDRCVGVGLSTVLKRREGKRPWALTFILSALGCDVPNYLDSPVTNVDWAREPN